MAKQETGPKNVLNRGQAFYLRQWQLERRDMLEGPHDRASVIEVATRDLGFPLSKTIFSAQARTAGVKLGAATYGDTQLNVRLGMVERSLEQHQKALVLLAKLVDPGVEQLPIQCILELVVLAGSDSGAVRDAPGQMMLVGPEEAAPADEKQVRQLDHGQETVAEGGSSE